MDLILGQLMLIGLDELFYQGISAGEIIHPTRLALTGLGSGPSLFVMMELLGKEICLRRLQKAINTLPVLDH